jgi:hypothetical protein
MAHNRNVGRPLEDEDKMLNECMLEHGGYAPCSGMLCNCDIHYTTRDGPKTVTVCICSYHANTLQNTMSEPAQEIVAESADEAVKALMSKFWLLFEENCICASLGNELHIALIKYTFGFNEVSPYHCDACASNHPLWKKDDEFEKKLPSIDEIERLVSENPDLLSEKNSYDKTPTQIIPELIETLEEVCRPREYLKNKERALASSNIEKLCEIQELLKQYGGD